MNRPIDDIVSHIKNRPDVGVELPTLKLEQDRTRGDLLLRREELDTVHTAKDTITDSLGVDETKTGGVELWFVHAK